MKKNKILVLPFLLSGMLVHFATEEVYAADNSLNTGTVTTKNPGTITNPDGSKITIPSTDNTNTVTNPDGSEYDNNHVYNSYKNDGTYPDESIYGVTETRAYSAVGAGFLEGSLSLISVPNFDFGANTLDGRTRFIPLFADANNSVKDAAFINSSTDAMGNIVKRLNDPSKYRALIVSDSRMPIDGSGSYNGWKVLARMSVGDAASLVGSNSNSNSSSDPNPNAGHRYLGSDYQFPAVIEFGNGYNDNSYTISSLSGGQSGNSTPISHPATYYNSDPNITGGVDPISGNPKSIWNRVDKNTYPNPDGIPNDNSFDTSTEVEIRGLYFPRLRRTPIRNNPDQVTGAGGHLTSHLDSPSTANNDGITTIPMDSGIGNEIWGYSVSQKNNANASNSSGFGPDNISNGAWALDFHDKGSAIMSLPEVVTMNRPGTYIYNLYWTLSNGFQQNPY